MEFKGYHGTSVSAATSIRTEGFKISSGSHEWLGDGVYFFIHDISDPEDDAVKWGIVNAWDNEKKCNKYDGYAVIVANIKVDDEQVFDLRIQECSNFFNEYRSKFIAKVLASGRSYDRIKDAIIINEMRDSGIRQMNVVINRVYTQLTSDFRIFKVKSCIPNTTICSVFEKNCIIDTRIVKTGPVI